MKSLFQSRYPRSSNGILTLFFIVAIMSLLVPNGQAANRNWQNSGTDFNTGTNWSGNAVPGPSDMATFGTAKITNPNLSASVTTQLLNFSTAASSGYDLTSSTTSIKLTLTSTGTAATSAINAANTSGTNTIDAPLVLGAAANATQTFTQASGGTLILNGAITSTNTNVTLNLTGTGKVLVNGTIASTIPVTVTGSGTTLGGIGTISGSVNVGAGAILNPGPAGAAGTAAAVGTLHTGALTLQSTSISNFDVANSTTYDKLISSAALNLAGTLNVTVASGQTFNAGDRLNLFTGTSETGTFTGIADNQLVFYNGYAFTADYTTTGFDLVAVPEPSTWVAAGLSVLVIAYSQRRRFARAIKRPT
jgi:hypothetical protein